MKKIFSNFVCFSESPNFIKKYQITPIKGVAFILVFVIPKLFDFIITGSLVFGQLANILEKNAFLTKVIDHKYSKHWFYTVASTIDLTTIDYSKASFYAIIVS